MWCVKEFAHTPVVSPRLTVATRGRAVELLCGRTPRPTAVAVNHVAHFAPPPLTVPFTLHFITHPTHPAVHSIGREGERRRRRRRRKSRRHSRPSVGLAGPERIRRSAYRVKVMLLPTVTFLPCISPLSSVVNVPLEIHRDSGGFAMLRHSRRRRSPVLVVFGGIAQFGRRRCGCHAGVARPARSHILVLPWD